jgi:translation elongation factor EF-1alpha
MAEEKVGTVIKFFAKPSVAAIQVTAGTIRVGDRLKFLGATTDFETGVASMQEEHQTIDQAGPGQMVGIKVPDRVREGDSVFKVT